MTANHHENNGTDRPRAKELAVLATTRALDQLSAEEEAVLVSAMAKGTNEALFGTAEQASRLAPAIAEALTASDVPSPSAELRGAIEAELDGALVSPANASPAKSFSPAKSSVGKGSARTRRLNWLDAALALATVGVLALLLLPAVQTSRESARRMPQSTALPIPETAESDTNMGMGTRGESSSVRSNLSELSSFASQPSDAASSTSSPNESVPNVRVLTGPALNGPPLNDEYRHVAEVRGGDKAQPTPMSTLLGNERPLSLNEAGKGQASIAVRPTENKPAEMPPASYGQLGRGIAAKKLSVVADPKARAGDSLDLRSQVRFQDGVVTTYETLRGSSRDGSGFKQIADGLGRTEHEALLSKVPSEALVEQEQARELRSASGEAYAAIRENAFRLVRDEPLSTFSIDVDTASYANVRRFLTQGQLPPKDAVRIEELLNYFSYDYPQPQEKDPFSVNMEVTECPWRPENRLLRVGLKGRDVPRQQRAASNLVFLIDVSGSMQPENKLPLVKTALKMLVQELTENDRVSIVTYAGDAGLKLPSTNGTEQRRILDTIESLSAGGSTHGSAGIALAYEQAAGYFIRGGTNRVILLTDGDLNVGITDDDALVQLIKEKAKTGVFLTVLGVGDGNLKDSKMEKLADHGNGVYAYLDGVREARKVLVEQMSGSLITIAKDVKLQIEFNPAQVQAYRLVGYENRVLANRDFHDDSKDAGEIGAGHTVTALYELVPAHAALPVPGEPLKYQPQRVEELPVRVVENASRELLTLKLRFKQPEADRSELRDYPLADRDSKFGQASTDFRFASSVAMFGLVLRDSQYRGSANLAAVEEIATSSLGEDQRGYRSEFVDLVRKAEQLK